MQRMGVDEVSRNVFLSLHKPGMTSSFFRNERRSHLSRELLLLWEGAADVSGFCGDNQNKQNRDPLGFLVFPERLTRRKKMKTETPGAPAPEPQTTTQIPPPAGRRWWNPDIAGFFGRESTLEVLDRVVSEPAALVMGLGLFVGIGWLDWWGWVDPFLTLVGLPFVGAAYYEHWRLKNRRYKPVEHDKPIVAVLCVKQAAGQSVSEHFGRPADVFLSTAQELGNRLELSPEEMLEFAKKFVDMLVPYQHRPIYLSAAVPPAMAMYLGRLLVNFTIVPLNYNPPSGDKPGLIVECPVLTLQDLVV